jgi:hypothetical protein
MRFAHSLARDGLIPGAVARGRHRVVGSAEDLVRSILVDPAPHTQGIDLIWICPVEEVFKSWACGAAHHGGVYTSSSAPMRLS